MSQIQYLHAPSRPSPLAQVHLTRPISTAPPPSLQQQQQYQQHQQQQQQQQQQQSPPPPPPQEAQGLIRDPLFWKRFSTAVHANERPIDLECPRRDTGSTSSSVDAKRGNDWLAQQRKEKRRCRTLCISITLAVIVLIAGATFAGWYLTKVKKIHISL